MKKTTSGVIIAFFLASLILVALAFFITSLVTNTRSNTPSPVEKAWQLVPLGSSREEAIATLTEEAWYYEPCANEHDNIATDLFFYNSHRYDEADIVVVHYLLAEDGEWQVSWLARCDPADWQVLFQDCIDRSQFED